MSSSSRKKKKKQRKGSDFLTRKKVAKKATHDSMDFDNEDKYNHRDSSRDLGIGDKIEIALHNVGETVEEKTDILRHNTKNLKNFKKIQKEDAVNIVDVIVPQKLIRWIIGFVITIYGFVGIFSIILLIVYCLNYFVSTVYRSYSNYDYIFLYTIIGLISFGAFIGLYGTFKYGEIDEQMEVLDKENKKLTKQIKAASTDNELLGNSISAFNLQVDTIMDNKSDLKSQIKAFQRLENELKQESKSNNQEIIEFLKEVQKLFREFKILQTTVERANLLSLFYELEFRDDDIEGLSRSEFEKFKSRLDNETAKKFRHFDLLDTNGDETIDMNEFERECDRIFNTLSTKSMFGFKSKAKGKRKKGTNIPKINEWSGWLK